MEKRSEQPNPRVRKGKRGHASPFTMQTEKWTTQANQSTVKASGPRKAQKRGHASPFTLQTE
jgi:hypothetical protein